MSRISPRSIRFAILPSLVLLALAGPARGQSILTVAGGATDDGRPATAAGLNLPQGVAVDAAGNLYIADSLSNRIRRVDAGTGLIATIAGTGDSEFTGDGGPATSASLSLPAGVAVDASGNVYISDAGNNRIRKVAAGTGIISTFAGNGTRGYSGDNGPAAAAAINFPGDIALDTQGNLYIADYGNNRVRKVAGGTITTVAGIGLPVFSGDGGPAGAAGLAFPSDVALDGSGNLYIADYGNNRVRKVAAGTGTISTIAGNGAGGFSGDGGPAVAATFRGVTGVATDAAGNVYVADIDNNRVRRVIVSTGVIATVAGNGTRSFSGDGGPATAAGLSGPVNLVLDAGGNLLIADMQNDRIRRVAGGSGVITTVAGGAGAHGDGGPAVAASLNRSYGAVVDAAGNTFLADTNANIVRKIASGTGIITTVAGTGEPGFSGDGGSAVAAMLTKPYGVVVDGAGNLLIADTFNNRIRKVAAGSGIISTFAGNGQKGFSGDGGAAAAAALNLPAFLALDGSGNLYLSDSGNSRVRKVAAGSGIISTVAGNGQKGFSGDGGPATAAALNSPRGVAVDGSGNLFVADADNNRVRKVTSGGTITTVAGKGTAGFSGDGGPATAAALSDPFGVALDTHGNLYVADANNHRVRRVSAGGTISTFAGSGIQGFSGDGAPAIAARLSQPSNVTLDGAGNLFISDLGNNRLRSVSGCVPVTAPALSGPATGATVSGSSATLAFVPVSSAFRYDLYLDTANPPAKILSADLGFATATPYRIPSGAAYAYTAQNLTPGATYYWKVVSKGDPFCPPVSTATSEVRRFTVAGGCNPPGAVALAAPADGATGVSSQVALSWQAAPGAGTYDLYLGSSAPPPLAAAGLTGTGYTASGLTPGATYYWSVKARASCDASKTTASAVRSFRVAGGCTKPGGVGLSSPANGATGVASNPTLSWASSPNASSYDLYLGEASNPPLLQTSLTTTSAQPSGLAAGVTYFWQVVARTSCDPGLTTASAIQSFTVAGACNTPGAPTIVSAPAASVSVGQTYVVTWSEASGLDAGGGYVVERATNGSFNPILDSQTTTATAASFTSAAEGTYYHRVKAVPACDPARAGGYSAVRSVSVASALANVIFTVPPSAVVTTLGQKIEDQKTSFTLENIGSAPLGLQLTQQYLPNAGNNPVAFFTIADPLGGSTSGFTLAPRTPKTFEIHFQGADPNVAASYQGMIIVFQANSQPLPNAPFAFVNLKVGGGADTATPSFLVGGVAAEYAVFPGASGDGGGRTISADILNPGSTPMDLAAEIGPELWLVPQTGWNSTPIPPGAARTVNFTTDRTRAPNGSALPRQTYFTVKTRSGQTARLLVQDNDAAVLAQGRTSLLPPGTLSYIVPSVVRSTSKVGNTFITKLRLSNAGSEPVQTDLYFTPHDTDGFAGTVRNARVVVPANDLVTLTDPLVQLFDLSGNVWGQLEVQVPTEKLAFITVSSGVDAPANTGGTFGFQLPTATRGDGARSGQAHVIPGVTYNARYRTNLILAETTGVDHAVVRATLFDEDGTALGNTLLDVPRYGQRQVPVTDLGATDGLQGGQITIAVEAGGGTVVGLVTVVDNTNDDAVTYLGGPSPKESTGSEPPTLLRRLAPRPAWATAASSTLKYIVPSVVNGYATFRDQNLPYTFQSLMGFTSITQAPATFRLTYHDLNTGQSIAKTVTVPGRGTRAYENALEELFGIPAGQKSQGPVFIEADRNGTAYCKVFSILANGTLGDSFPVVPVPSESLTGQLSAKPIYVDGLEQSLDIRRGTRSNLILNEVTGLAPATVTVRLYEAGNRTSPLAQADVSLAPGEKQQLSTVFAGVGLESDQRRKDRANVLCVVTAKSGAGLVSAVVTMIDNKTGDIRNLLLTPTGGVRASGGGGSIRF